MCLYYKRHEFVQVVGGGDTSETAGLFDAFRYGLLVKFVYLPKTIKL